MKDTKLRWTNFSGDTFEDMYTAKEADILFYNKCESNTQVELIPATGQWYTVWNRKLDKCIECWKGA